MLYIFMFLLLVWWVLWIRFFLKKKENQSGIATINKKDFWPREIKCKKLYQWLQGLLASLKWWNVKSHSEAIVKYLEANKSILWEMIYLMWHELITMINVYHENPKDPQSTPENIKKIMLLLKETIIKETNFTVNTFDKVKIK